MAEEAKEKTVNKIDTKGGKYVELEFIEKHGSKKVGDKETYHHTTANALVHKLKVAKVVKNLKTYKPKKEAVN
jgi:hypothetical protein